MHGLINLKEIEKFIEVIKLFESRNHKLLSITEWKAKFQLAVSENNVVIIYYPSPRSPWNLSKDPPGGPRTPG